MLELISNAFYKMNNISDFIEIRVANELTMLTNKKIQTALVKIEEWKNIVLTSSHDYIKIISKLQNNCH